MTQDFPTSNDNPIDVFIRWFEAAKVHPAQKEPTAMTVATVDAKGKPHARTLLLKEVGEKGFCFFTHYTSPKSLDLQANSQAALVFYWNALDRQVRVEGKVAQCSATESDAYYESRPRRSRIGAWASQQSQPLASHEMLMQRVAEMEKQFEGKEVPRPDHWGGWRVTPTMIEFWDQGENRLHHRFRFTRNTDGSWAAGYLFP